MFLRRSTIVSTIARGPSADSLGYNHITHDESLRRMFHSLRLWLRAIAHLGVNPSSAAYREEILVFAWQNTPLWLPAGLPYLLQCS